jgi:hypothetical protein
MLSGTSTKFHKPPKFRSRVLELEDAVDRAELRADRLAEQLRENPPLRPDSTPDFVHARLRDELGCWPRSHWHALATLICRSELKIPNA